MSRPVRVFICYADADEQYAQELTKHLVPLIHEGLIDIFHSGLRHSASEHQKSIEPSLQEAQVFVALLSTDFFTSPYAAQEMELATQRPWPPVIPIIVRPCLWSETAFGARQVLPRNGMPVSLWPNPDEAWVDVSNSIKQVILREAISTPGHPTKSRESRKDIFISYNHANKKWLKDVQNHLSSLRQGGVIDHWDDTRIQPGSVWEEEIKQALKRARFAVLLVSSEFLASDFIIKNELPPILEGAKEEGLVIMQLIINPCRLPKTLSRFQTVNPPSKTLIEMKSHERARIFVKLAEEIEAAVAASQ